MSLPILTGARDWPAVLLAPGSASGGEAGTGAPAPAGAWEAYRERRHEPDARRGHQHRQRVGAARPAAAPASPPARKWRDCASQPSGSAYVVANGFEADPGAQVDRTLMERDPHAVVEGVAIAAWAVRAESAIIVVRASAVTAAARLRAAIAAAEAARLHRCRGRRRRVDRCASTVRELTGSFVVGEETVLLRALEDRRAQPDQRPPYPVPAGPVGQAHARQQREDARRGALDRPANGAGAFASLGDAGGAGHDARSSSAASCASPASSRCR